MRKHTTIKLLLSLITISIASLSSAEPIACSAEIFSEVKSIHQLPVEVGNIMGADKKGEEGIADRGLPFQESDVALGEELPFKRFYLAAVSEKCILAAIETGGIGYSVKIYSFELVSNKWKSNQVNVLYELPNSIQELLLSTNKQRK